MRYIVERKRYVDGFDFEWKFVSAHDWWLIAIWTCFKNKDETRILRLSKVRG